MIACVEPSIKSGFLEFGVCTRALPGESESGDLHLIAPFPKGVLIAVVDGLGHGCEAAVAARAATASLRSCPQGPLTDLVQRCHAALQKTRGVVLGIASIDADRDQLSWLGVGNVEGVLLRADPTARPSREVLPHRGGVLGYQMPPLRMNTVPVACGDTLVFATDGIDSSFPIESPASCDPQTLADDIVRRHGKQTDDALVLVARYIGSLP